MENLNSLNQLDTPGAETHIRAAQAWMDFGVQVIPVLRGTLEPASPSSRWHEDLSYKTIEVHWNKNPDHEVAYEVGNRLVVFRVNTPQARTAFQALLARFQIKSPWILEGGDGAEYLYWLGDKTSTALAVTSGKGPAARIEVLTGKATLLLPPYGGKRCLAETSNTGDLTEVSQAFLDAVAEFNTNPAHGCSPAEIPDGGAELVAVTAPPAILAASGTGQNKADEGGDAGPDGGDNTPFTPFTTFTTFTTFAGPPSREKGPEAPVITPPPAAPKIPVAGPKKGGDAGEGGAMSIAGRSVAESTFMALQTASPSASSPQDGVTPGERDFDDDADDVLTPKALENPVVTAIKASGLYMTPLGAGGHELTCPWAHEHADGAAINSTYFEPDDRNLTGVFCCPSHHHKKYGTKNLLEKLAVDKLIARHKPLIRLVSGEMHRVLDACESVLADRAAHYQSGGMIVSVTTCPSTGDPTIEPTNLQALTRALSEAAAFGKFSARNGWAPSDPPTRHTGLLHRLQDYRHLPVLVGVARQPHYRVDGELVTQPGYDKVSKRFGVFDPGQFVVPPHPTKDMALASLATLEGLLSEFRFATPCDKAAALSAMLTGAVRPALPHAPAFHVQAAIYGSGKSYLCEVIAPFAGPAESLKISFPPTSEEATKAIMAVLVKNPAVVEFDDMTTDLLPHGIINRMLTTEALTDRILGHSKTATVSTRTLFLSSGNNVGPVRDLLRRVATIKLDPLCATPATITYKGNPADLIRKNRGAYVAAALTIIQAWRNAGSPRANVSSLATYGGEWADFCRHPLIWLGVTDPAASLLEQVQSDPDGDALGALLTAWFKAFGSSPTTVRKVIGAANFGQEDLKDAFSEFLVVERGEINPSKLGWVLKKNANRIVGGLKFVDAHADGRKAWRVISVGAPPSPPSPPLAEPDCDTDDRY